MRKRYHFIADQLREQGCPVRIINGMPDHIHCLFLLNPQKSIAEVIKQIKGSSSHFINQNNLLPVKFSWQTEYAAFSVSESGVEKVFNRSGIKRRIIKKSLSCKNLINSWRFTDWTKVFNYRVITVVPWNHANYLNKQFMKN